MIKNYAHPLPYDLVVAVEDLELSEDEAPDAEDEWVHASWKDIDVYLAWRRGWFLCRVEHNGSELRFGRADPYELVTDLEDLLELVDGGVVSTETDRLESPSERLTFGSDAEVFTQIYHETMREYLGDVFDLSVRSSADGGVSATFEIRIVDVMGEGFNTFLRKIQRYDLTLERINQIVETIDFNLDWMQWDF